MKSCINGATTMPYSLEEDISSAGKAGFEGVEIWSAKLEKYLKSHTPEDLKEELQRSGVKAACLCAYGLNAFSKDKELERIRKAAEVAEAIDCPLILVCPDSPPEGTSEGEAFKQAGQAARALGEICGEYGVKVAIEPLGLHPFVPGPREGLRIVEESGRDNVGIMMDTFHYFKSGVSIEEIAAIPMEKLLIVHINDCEDLPREELRDSNRLYPGLGIIPLKEMLGAIKKNGYQGYLSVEVFREEYWRDDPLTISLNSKRYLDSVLKGLSQNDR